MKTSTVILSLGGNQKNTLTNFTKAIKEINARLGDISEKSSIYYSEAWGFKEETPSFLNQIVKLETNLPPQSLLLVIQDIESELGRTPKTRPEYESRIIDIDILFYDNEIVNTQNLTIPHPLMHKRKFILIPLSEILSNFIHPTFQKTIKQLLLQCEDDLEVKKL